MRRPPWESASAIRSIARAICGKARFTAAATLASSRLMMRAISSEALRSRSADAVLVFSVARWRRLLSLRFTRLAPDCLQRVVGGGIQSRLWRLRRKQILRFAQDDKTSAQ